MMMVIDSVTTTTTTNISDSEQNSMQTTTTDDYLQFMHLVEKLKTTKRQGWCLRGIFDGESVSDHMYRMALMAMTLPQRFLDYYNQSEFLVDRQRAVWMCLVHDLAECIAGDITPECGISSQEKIQREMMAMQHIRSLVEEPQSSIVWDLFQEYEQGQTATSLFVKDLDKLEFLVQATEYQVRYDNDDGDNGSDDSGSAGTGAGKKKFEDFFANTLPRIRNTQLLAYLLPSQI